MTDQRPIDVSTLRGGDIVRAKRGEYGVVEGVFHSYPISSGWGIGSEAEEDGLFAWNDKGWTITDILATPEPAPIEVGDWWKSATGIVAVVLGVDGDTLTWRRLDGSLPLAGRTHVMAESWTRLDGPPEPPVGSVYVLVGIVWHHQAEGHVPASPVRVNGPWAGIRTWKEQRSLYNVRQLATLQIVHTLGVE